MRAEFGPIRADIEAKLDTFFNHLNLVLSDLENEAELKEYAMRIADRKISQIQAQMRMVYKQVEEGKIVPIPESDIVG